MHAICQHRIPGTPVTPLPIGGRPLPFPGPTLRQHIEDHNDPHGTRKLVPALRTGSGAPSVMPADKETDLYFDMTSRTLYVCVTVDDAREWRMAGSGFVPPSTYVPDECYNPFKVESGVKHYKKQVLAWDEEMGAYALEFVGDYIRDESGHYVEA